MGISNFLRLRNAKPPVMEGQPTRPMRKAKLAAQPPSLPPLPMGLKLNAPKPRSSFYGD